MNYRNEFSKVSSFNVLLNLRISCNDSLKLRSDFIELSVKDCCSLERFILSCLRNLYYCVSPDKDLESLSDDDFALISLLSDLYESFCNCIALHDSFESVDNSHMVSLLSDYELFYTVTDVQYISNNDNINN